MRVLYTVRASLLCTFLINFNLITFETLVNSHLIPWSLISIQNPMLWRTQISVVYYMFIQNQQVLTGFDFGIGYIFLCYLFLAALILAQIEYHWMVHQRFYHSYLVLQTHVSHLIDEPMQRGITFSQNTRFETVYPLSIFHFTQNANGITIALLYQQAEYVSIHSVRYNEA